MITAEDVLAAARKEYGLNFKSLEELSNHRGLFKGGMSKRISRQETTSFLFLVGQSSTFQACLSCADLI